jgi:hypothetical protein
MSTKTLERPDVGTTNTTDQPDKPVATDLKADPFADPGAAAQDVLSGQLALNQYEERVGNRTYTIKELDVARFFEVGEILNSEAEALGEAGLLKGEAWEGIDRNDYTQIALKIAQIYRKVPVVVSKLLALIMRGDKPDDGEYIMHTMGLRQFARVIREFMETNAWADLAEDFFQIGAGVRTTIQRVSGADPVPQEPQKPPTS